MNILELRREIDNINNKYDAKIAELKIQISQIENERLQELAGLPDEYENAKEQIIEDYKQGLKPVKGVTVKSLKSVLIVDESKIPDNYKKYIVDDKKIKADLKESAYTKEIPGVEVNTKYSIAISVKNWHISSLFYTILVNEFLVSVVGLLTYAPGE